ncbi:MAG: MarR family transcriptional regulator [Bacteroidales bacterium]
MNDDVRFLIDQFLNILHLYSIIARKPNDFGTGDKLYFTEIHTISMIGKNREINMTQLASMMGVTKGAISQTVRKLVAKGLILKVNKNNRKEVCLRLSERGEKALVGQESFKGDIFEFAGALYEKVSPGDVVLVKRLFASITENMQERVKAL